MKFLILALCFCLAVADESQLMDDLEKLLSSGEEDSPPVPVPVEKSILEELDALSQDAKESEKRGLEYGYCLDGKTRADGPNMRGCARKLCFDERPGQCNKELEKLSSSERKIKCYKSYSHYRERCPFSCGFCKPASPGLECRRKYGSRAKYGCCWDGMPALRADKSDCMACMDINKHACRQFYNNMLEQKCGTNSYRIRSFLFMRCPKLCGRC